MSGDPEAYVINHIDFWLSCTYVPLIQFAMILFIFRISIPLLSWFVAESLVVQSLLVWLVVVVEGILVCLVAVVEGLLAWIVVVIEGLLARPVV